MSLLESGENYLEAILMVKEKKDSVHAIDIVNELNFLNLLMPLLK